MGRIAAEGSPGLYNKKKKQTGIVNAHADWLNPVGFFSFMETMEVNHGKHKDGK